MPLNNYDRVRSLLAAIASFVGESRQRSSGTQTGEQGDWHSMWSAVAARLGQLLDARDLAGFDAGARIVADALNICEAPGRQVAMPLLFGDFTRRAIGAGVDRTEFVKWFGPKGILRAEPGRVRGRVLYFSDAKGRGKILGSDRVVYFCHFSQIGATGFRSVNGGQLVEFTPQRGSFNGVEGFGAYKVTCISENEQGNGAV